ncbi:MAG: crossover junction endodeoxyribonuclease RuvC [Candidatus Doudnabacteria bacterium]|nr:crossover junction endodeoxyribonuclease RuvC [Candidatus Doudnabacteria bacterium]
MTILGIDPGTATTGFGIIQKDKDGNWQAVDFGVITTDKHEGDAERLHVLALDLVSIIKKYNPDAAGVEKLFFETNVKTAITVAQARGVILQTLAAHHVPLYEYTPLQVKSSLTGYGSADKKQMQYMVKQTFALKTIPKPDDAADALAIALCCATRMKHDITT